MSADREKFCARCQKLTSHRQIYAPWWCRECGEPAALEAIYPGHPDYAALDASVSSAIEEEANAARRRHEGRTT